MQKHVAQITEFGRYEPRMEGIVPEKADELKQDRAKVKNKFRLPQRSIEESRPELQRKKDAFQFLNDIDDEKFWIHQTTTLVTSFNVCDNISEVIRMKKHNQTLRFGMEKHHLKIEALTATGNRLIGDKHPDSDRFQELLQDLASRWNDLKDAISDRDERLDSSERAQQYFSDADQAEQWMSEQELYLIVDEEPTDESTAQACLRELEAVQNAVTGYHERVRNLNAKADQLVKDGNSFMNQVLSRQSEVEQAYAGLKDLSHDRLVRVGDTMSLFLLQSDVDDLEEWIAEKEVVACSHDLGQDFDHVTILRERFDRFCEETEAVGADRVAKANEEANALIRAGHHQTTLIAQLKDRINAAWENLRELMQKRSEHLAGSYDLHKYYWECDDLFGCIQEKQHAVSEDLNLDTETISAYQRKHANFQQDLEPLGQRVEGVQERATGLLNACADDRLFEIQARKSEVVNAWRNLQLDVDVRHRKLTDTGDLYRFFNMVRDLMSWMDDISLQMNTSEKASDVSGVELLMNDHQSLRAEIDARDYSFADCIELGKNLLSRNHDANPEIKVLEVYQFARNSHFVEGWLIDQEPYLFNRELGQSVEEVERLMKQHESFEKYVAAQDERFKTLERLTTLELIAMDVGWHAERERQRAEERREDEERLQLGFGCGADDVAGAGAGQPGIAPPRAPSRGGRIFCVTRVEEPSTPQRVQICSTTSVPTGSRAGAGITHASPTLSSNSGAQERTPVIEGALQRKRDTAAGGLKASNRSWIALYFVIRGSRLYAFRNEKSFKSYRDVGTERTYHGEDPLELVGVHVNSVEHHAKKHAFRLVTADASSCLFNARSDDEALIWVETIRGLTEDSSS